MLKSSNARIALVVISLSLCLAAGIIGGFDFGADVALIHRLQEIRAASPRLTWCAIAITHVGSAFGTLGGGFGVAGWLAWRGERWRAGVLAATVMGERLVVDGMKYLVDRTRPTFDLHPVATHSSSFPSGHAGNSMAVFLAIALIAVPRAYRRAAVVCALLASLLVGITRPYLGVHWPSDVIGGWALGAAIAIVAWTIADSRESAAAQQ